MPFKMAGFKKDVTTHIQFVLNITGLMTYLRSVFRSMHMIGLVMEIKLVLNLECSVYIT